MVTEDSGVAGVVPVVSFLLENGSMIKPTVFGATFVIHGVVYRNVVRAIVEVVRYESLERITE